MKVNDKPKGKGVKANAFFKTQQQPRDADAAAASDAARHKGPASTRIRRKELIAKKEKLHFKHKFEKQLRYERKAELRKQKEANAGGETTLKTPALSRPGARDRMQPRELSQEAKKSSKNPAVNTLYRRAQTEYEKKQEEKKRQQEEIAKKEAEKQKALQMYKQKKKKTFHNLCKKTKKGQILMSRQVDSLLSKIEQQASKTKSKSK